jgi:ornithine cyclodeaminase
MRADDILILKSSEVDSLLATREVEVMEITRRAYLAHADGDSSLPHSNFLRFPNNHGNRIIALPAYLGAEFGVAGLKWISSFPGNLESGQDRASAVLILNSAQTGRPQSIIEASIISAKRTAASASLAAQQLQGQNRASCVGLIGAGLISFEIARFLLAGCHEIRKLVVFDIEPERSEFFRTRCEHVFKGIEIEIADELGSVLSECPLISLATTATHPHVTDLSRCRPGSTILHISLRDLAPEVILSCANIVDDIDHVCRAETSIHLAEQRVGHRDFIRGTLADVLNGSIAPRRDPEDILVFSPFGLGVLDVALGNFVRELALKENLGTVINSFLPEPWSERNDGRPSQQ